MLKTNPCSDRARGKGFGEVGMADCLYIRYLFDPHDLGGVPLHKKAHLHVAAEVLWIEFKRPRVGVTAQHQIDWQLTESRRGALVLCVNDIDNFLTWYRASGLNCGKV